MKKELASFCDLKIAEDFKGHMTQKTQERGGMLNELAFVVGPVYATNEYLES